MSDDNWSGQRIMVTGATGLVGSWLTRALVDRGADVTVLVRDMDPRSELLRSGTVRRVHVVAGALEDAQAVERAIVEHESSTVFHLGAQTIVGAAVRTPASTLATNVLGTWNVLEAARRHADLVSAVIVASSDKAYGTGAALPYTEDMPLHGDGPYDVSKSCTDLISQSYAHTYDLPVAIARCGNIFGGGDLNWSRIVPGTIRWLLEGVQPVLRSDGTFLRDYLHVDDVVTAYLALGEHLRSGDLVAGSAFNFAAETPLSVMRIYEAICEATVGTVVTPIVQGQASTEIRDQYLDASLAHERLGWRTTVTLQEGLSRTVAWYRSLLGTR